MKLLLNCINIILCSTFEMIGLIFPIRNVYISSQIQTDQIYYIQKSINKFNLTRTYDKSENHIKIQYKNDIVGNIEMTSNLYSIGSFVIESTIISFNPNLYDEILGCVILHELGHSQGLQHNSKVGSIMNWTLYVDNEGYILNKNTEFFLSDDDLLALEFMRQKNN